MLLILYTATAMPFAIFFLDGPTVGWQAVDIIVMVLFVTDLILNFNTGYYDAAGYPVVNRHVLSAVCMVMAVDR